MKWWLKFPRKVGSPSKTVCRTKEDFISLFNRMNGNSDKVYVSVFQCDYDGAMDNVEINVIPFDIDWEHKYDTMVELHNHLNKLNISHQVMFSTGGFWVYAFCTPETYLKNDAKRKLASMQDYLLEGTDILFGNSKDSPIDISVRGDIERLTRMPFSFDNKRKRFVIFLNQDDINNGMDNIIRVSETCDQDRRFKVYTFGGSLLDSSIIKTYHPQPRVMNDVLDIKDTVMDIPETISETHKRILEMFPDFMRAWILDTDCATWQARAYTTLFLREKGLTKEQTETFLKPFYEPMPRTDKYKNNWEHYLGVGCSELIYRRTDLFFPNMKKLWELGLIPKKYVEIYGERYSPVYR